MQPAGVSKSLTRSDIPYKQNFYSVPFTRIGQTLPVRVTDSELIVYAPQLTELARHTLASPGAQQKLTTPEHRPSRDEQRRVELLAARFAELGPDGPVFFEQLVRTRRYGKDEAHRLLGLLATYAQNDVAHALSRARRYRAFSLTAVENTSSSPPRSSSDDVPTSFSSASPVSAKAISCRPSDSAHVRSDTAPSIQPPLR